jgi:hypothetical protein
MPGSGGGEGVARGWVWQELGPPRGWRPCWPDPSSDLRAAYTDAARRGLNRALTDEGLMSQEYFEEAEAGASLIVVLAPEPRLVTEARQILATHGARHMRFYDSKCITDLT